jgi:hypothetical protein
VGSENHIWVVQTHTRQMQTRARARARARSRAHTRLHAHPRPHAQTHTHTHTHRRAHACTHTRAHTHTHTHTHGHTRARMRVFIYTRKHRCSLHSTVRSSHLLHLAQLQRPIVREVRVENPQVQTVHRERRLEGQTELPQTSPPSPPRPRAHTSAAFKGCKALP